VTIDHRLAARLEALGQGHLVTAVDRLPLPQRDRLVAQIRGLDLELVAGLARRYAGPAAEGEEPPSDIAPPEAIPIPDDAAARAREEQAREEGQRRLRAGELACVLLAGGQGTRLGFPGPKGDFPFAPVSGRTLFEHHAAKVVAVRRRYGCELPLLVLTSPANDEVTREIFAAHDHFGLGPEGVEFVVQGTMPAVDRESGAILLEAPDRLALSPDGHGGLLAALRADGALERLRRRGVRTIFTFQVDNPLLSVAHPAFVGYHALAGAEMSSMVVHKASPEERMGVVARVDGRTAVVEYSDLPDEMARWRDSEGRLVLWAGSIAVHCIEVAFVERLTGPGQGLPFHRALKRVSFVAADGGLVEPEAPNGIKFETFLFDALPLAGATTTVEVAREDEFSPIKNAEGDDSPATARAHLNRRYARWLEGAGVPVARDAAGEPVDLEIDPLLALDADELAHRLPPMAAVERPTALGPDASTVARAT